jgi:hypothetical protein
MNCLQAVEAEQSQVVVCRCCCHDAPIDIETVYGTLVYHLLMYCQMSAHIMNYQGPVLSRNCLTLSPVLKMSLSSPSLANLMLLTAPL